MLYFVYILREYATDKVRDWEGTRLTPPPFDPTPFDHAPFLATSPFGHIYFLATPLFGHAHFWSRPLLATPSSDPPFSIQHRSRDMTKIENFSGSRKVPHILKVWSLLITKLIFLRHLPLMLILHKYSFQSCNSLVILCLFDSLHRNLSEKFYMSQQITWNFRVIQENPF
jgi:hypothetical protein